MKPTRLLFALSAALLVFERVGLFALAVGWSSAESRNEKTWIVCSIILGLLYFARAALTASLRSRIESSLYGDAIRAIFRGNLLKTDDVELQTILIDGVDAHARAAEIRPNMMGDGIALVCVTVWALRLLPLRLGLLVLVSVTVSLIVATGVRRFAARASAEAWQRYEVVVRNAMEAVLGRVEIVAGAREKIALGRVDEAIALLRKSTRRSNWVSALSGRAPLVVALLGALVITRVAEPSATLTTSVIVASALPPFAGLAMSIIERERTKASREKMRLLLATPLSVTSLLDPPPSVSTVKLVSVSAQYEDGSLVLKNLSLRWECTKPLILAGPNGSGKSTILRMLVGLVPIKEGHILVDDVDLETIDRAAWRSQIAYLPQRPYLPSRSTIRNALAFLVPAATDALMCDALKRVDLLRSLEEKTTGNPLECDVDALSSGERQRLALARALLQDAKLYLLDEPDQNLDRKGLAIASSIIRELATKSAVILAAHDPEMLDISGHHIFLDHGCIVRSDDAFMAANEGIRSLAANG